MCVRNMISKENELSNVFLALQAPRGQWGREETPGADCDANLLYYKG